MLTSQPEAEWREFLARPSDQGGLSAVVYDSFDPIGAASADHHVELQPGVRPFREGIRDDLRFVTKVLLRARRRKAVPEWSVPAEVWAMLLAPSVRTKRGLERRGVAAAPPEALDPSLAA